MEVGRRTDGGRKSNLGRCCQAGGRQRLRCFPLLHSRRRGLQENGGQGEDLLENIHTNKTAKMFRCAAVMGGICGGAGETELAALCEYGLKIGLGFQVTDDILDVCGTSEHLGKTAGKDAKVDCHRR